MGNSHVVLGNKLLYTKLITTDLPLSLLQAKEVLICKPKKKLQPNRTAVEEAVQTETPSDQHKR